MTMRRAIASRTVREHRSILAIVSRAVALLIAGAALSIASAWISAVCVPTRLPPLHSTEFSSEYASNSKGVWWVTATRRASIQTMSARLDQTRRAQTDEEWDAVRRYWQEQARIVGTVLGSEPLELSPLNLSAVMPWNSPSWDRQNIRAVGRGWPLICMATIEHHDSKRWVSTPLGRGIPLPRWLTRLFGSSNFLDDRSLPLVLMWPAFAINTAVYAGLLWSAWLLIPFMRNRLRLRRNRCPRCAYSLAGQPAPGCPECGWNRNQASAPPVTD